jgi:hypothetical protein
MLPLFNKPIQNLAQNAMMNNPGMKQVMDYINASGGDPEKAFYKLAQEKGVDPQEILAQIRQMM